MWKSFKNRTFTCFLPLKYGEIYCFLHNKKTIKSYFFNAITPVSKL